MEDFKVSDLIQYYNHQDKTFRDGEIVEVIPGKIPYNENTYWSHQTSPTNRADMEVTATIKWLDGTQSNIKMSDLELRDSDLERQFRIESDTVQKEITKKLSEAHAALSKAVELSEKHGIPFKATISPIRQSYFPRSFSEKFGEIDQGKVSEVTGAYSEYPEDGGWQHSAVC